jgi:hypothetical protein
MSTSLLELRDELPVGDTRSTLDRLADELERTTSATPLHEKLVRWGWCNPNGNSLDWKVWQRKAPNYREASDRWRLQQMEER